MHFPLAPSRLATMAALVTLTGALFTGCATISPPPATLTTVAPRTEFGSRTEQVFYYESRVASAVLDRAAPGEIDDTGELDPTLAAADARMAEVCQYLNEAAVTRAEGQTASWELKFRVLVTTTTCERAAHEVELLLDNHGNSVATADSARL